MQLATFVQKNKFLLLFWTILVLLSKHIHLSVLIGEHYASLALLVVVLPIIGYFFPLRLSLPFGSAAWVLTHLKFPFPITLGIPTLFATLSWNVSSEKSLKNFLMHVCLPLFAMLLFYLSSVGSHAWPYSLFWCIPIALYFVSLKGSLNLVARALQSTFIAHAIGSIIWVYLIPMNSGQWLALIPIVAIERILMASLSVISILCCHAAQQITAINFSKGTHNFLYNSK